MAVIRSRAMSNAAVREATVRAVVMGVGFGAVFGAANAYLGLRVGLTIATSIPGGGDDRRAAAHLRLPGLDPRGQPGADDRIGVDVAGHRGDLHAARTRAAA